MATYEFVDTGCAAQGLFLFDQTKQDMGQPPRRLANRLPEPIRLTRTWSEYIDIHIEALQEMVRDSEWKVILFTVRKDEPFRKVLINYGSCRQARATVVSIIKAKAEIVSIPT